MTKSAWLVLALTLLGAAPRSSPPVSLTIHALTRSIEQEETPRFLAALHNETAQPLLVIDAEKKDTLQR